MHHKSLDEAKLDDYADLGRLLSDPREFGSDALFAFSPGRTRPYW
jgi:hypothetical protein